MTESYRLTEKTLDVFDCKSDFKESSWVSFSGINALSQALSDCIVTGPGLTVALAAAGLCQQARKHVRSASPEGFYYTLQEALLSLKSARPHYRPLTAFLSVMTLFVSEMINSKAAPQNCLKALETVHEDLRTAIIREEEAIRAVIARQITGPQTTMIIGGTGRYACVSEGTALAAVIEKHRQGLPQSVLCPRTLPLVATAGSNAFELCRCGIKTLIVNDAATAHVLLTKRPAAVYSVCNRICANGDVASGPGATTAAAAAKLLGIPFYLIGCSACMDPSTPDAESIQCETLTPAEFSTTMGEVCEYSVTNIVPRDWVSGFVTAQGLLKSPTPEVITKLASGYEARFEKLLEKAHRILRGG